MTDKMWEFCDSVFSVAEDSDTLEFADILRSNPGMLFTCVDSKVTKDFDAIPLYELRVQETTFCIVVFEPVLYEWMKEGIISVDNLYADTTIHIKRTPEQEKKAQEAEQVIREYNRRHLYKVEALGLKCNADEFKIRVDGSIVLLNANVVGSEYAIPPFVEYCGDMQYTVRGNPSFISSFRYCKSSTLKVINKDNRIKDMSYMFYGCPAIELDLTEFSVTGVTDMRYMFSVMFRLQDIQFGDWNTSACRDMRHMFALCAGVKKLAVESWDVANVRCMSHMFLCCMSVESLDLSAWKVREDADITSMFMQMDKLGHLDVSGWPVEIAKHNRLVVEDGDNLYTSEMVDLSKVLKDRTKK